jgi:hypothetical protein
MILNDVAFDIYSGERAQLAPGRLQHYWHRIASWHEGLPTCLTAEGIALPSHLKLQ